jgi:hypothetical protein
MNSLGDPARFATEQELREYLTTQLTAYNEAVAAQDATVAVQIIEHLYAEGGSELGNAVSATIWQGALTRLAERVKAGDQDALRLLRGALEILCRDASQ